MSDLKTALRAFRMISLPDAELIGRALRERDSYSCELSFPNLFMYAHGAGMEMTVWDSVILLLNRSERFFHFPPGRFIAPERLAGAVAAAREMGLMDGVVYDVPDDYLAAYPEVERYFEIESDPGEFDYLYDNAHLVGMDGAKLRKKHNLIRQFESEQTGFKVEMIHAANKTTASSLARAYNRRMTFAPFLAIEERAMELAWHHFEELNLSGMILYDGGCRPVGFSVWSLLNRNVADIHFEKADHECKGASQMLTFQVAQALHHRSVTYMNREQDMGNLGLRQAKHSLDPAFLFRRSTLTMQ